MSRAEKFDVIVVGAGPAGLSAAYTAAKGGLNVLLLERGPYPGSKNVMGGVLYRTMMDQVMPDFWKEAPLERHIIEQNLWVMTGDGAVTSFGHRNYEFAKEPYNNFTVQRAKFDRWFGSKVQEAGGLLICETTAHSLIMEGGKVAGVRVDRDDGDIYANVVILCDGVNSLLARKAGLHQELRPEDVSLTVKEVLALPREKIEDRFNLEGDQGATIEFVGDVFKGMVGMGFVYTNKESISIGYGCLISDFRRTLTKPYELLDQIKSLPAIRRLIQGAEIQEYLAHMIPEGGYEKVPPLYGDGWMIAGDSAGLVNAAHREGSNLAMTSGRVAAEVVLEARRRGDFSFRTLALYGERLRESFVVKDLRKYRHLPRFLEHTPELFSKYPQLVNSAAYEMLLVDGVPKADKQKKIVGRLGKQLGWLKLAKTAYDGWRAVN